MSEIVYNNILTIGFLLVWIATLIWYQYKRNTFDSGSFILVMYIVYSIFSIIVINDSLFSVAFEPLTFFPYVYLYVMMMIAMLPIINNHINRTTTIEPTNTRVLTWLSAVIIACSFLQIPDIITNFSSGLGQMFIDEGAGKEAYQESLKAVEDSGSAIRNLPAVIFNMCTDVTVFIFFYMLSQKKNYLLCAGLSLAMLLSMVIPITHGQRGGVIISFLTIVCGYFLYKQYLPKMLNRIMTLVGITVASIAAIPVGIITVSRFGNENAGVTGFISWYIGQGSLYFNNSGLDAGGIRYGDRTMYLIKRMIDPSTPKNFAERRDVYHNMEISDRFFTTFVGDFSLDFGPVIAFILFVVVFYSLYRLTRTTSETIKSYQLLMLFLVACISIQGGMYLFSFSDAGNLRIVLIVLLYSYLRYREILQKKFPLEQTNTPNLVNK